MLAFFYIVRLSLVTNFCCSSICLNKTGIVFILGSIFFFPALNAHKDFGCWAFFFGSFLYLVVTIHDLAEVRYNWKTSNGHDRKVLLEFVAAFSYVLGTVMFTAGSIFFLSRVGLSILDAWFFIFGSLLFVLGACINVLQIVYSRSMLTLFNAPVAMNKDGHRVR